MPEYGSGAGKRTRSFREGAGYSFGMGGIPLQARGAEEENVPNPVQEVLSEDQVLVAGRKVKGFGS